LIRRSRANQLDEHGSYGLAASLTCDSDPLWRHHASHIAIQIGCRNFGQ